MTKYVVSTNIKKSVEEHEFWEKDQETIIIVKGYRWGSWNVTTSDKNEPDFVRVHNPLGPESLLSIDMNSCCDNNIVDTDLISLDDVWYSDIIYPDNFTELEREYMDELLDKDGSEGWEQEGWIQTETECWVHGDLSIEKV
jgi:hypothetical protein